MANAIVVYRDKIEKNSWARWMVARTIRKNQNNLVAVIGKTGSGKTYSAISICEMMSEMDGVPFTIDHVVFSLTELMELINSKKLRKGSKIIFDEPQVSISAREFQSQANKVFNYLLSTFRHKNLTLFFCTPFESLLDKSTRKLFHVRMETVSINLAKRLCRLKPRFMEYSDYKEEPYKKRLIILHSNHSGKAQSQKLSFWDVPEPSEELISQYEAKKLEFTNRLNTNISTKLQEFEASGKSMTAEPQKPKRKPLTGNQEVVMRALANHTFEEASKILGRSLATLHAHKVLAMKKGYTLEEFREKEVKNLLKERYDKAMGIS